MKLARWAPRLTAATVGLTLAAALPASIGVASAQPGLGGTAAKAGLAGTTGPVRLAGPLVKLVPTQKHVSVPRFGKRVFIDPAVYVTTFGSPLEFRVQRASYAKPLTIDEVIKVPGGGTVLRPLPAWVLDGWNGLRRFLRITIRNSSGGIAGSKVMPFCPDTGNAQRAIPNSPASSPFPTSCGANPFTKGMVWGLQRGWGTDPFGSGFIFPIGVANPDFKLKLGKYHVTVTITRLWQRLLHISAADATAHVIVSVVKGGGCIDICPPNPGTRHPAAALPRLPDVPMLASPPASALPDLVPLPSWSIGVQNHKATKKHPVSSYLTFGATVWIGGHAQLDVEGFRSHESPVMAAYQYFWRNGKVIGRARAGTMGFDNKLGHHHWHFEQFAEYRLLNSTKSVIVRSQKIGFCIAPTDSIDLLISGAVWQPSETGFSGECGSPSALWVREMLPLGWGDTYEQFIAGQSFNVSNLPNGTYYIEIVANPEHVLRETNYRNDTSLRKVIISGAPGDRTVRVPAVHGIDPEG